MPTARRIIDMGSLKLNGDVEAESEGLRRGVADCWVRTESASSIADSCWLMLVMSFDKVSSCRVTPILQLNESDANSPL